MFDKSSVEVNLDLMSENLMVTVDEFEYKLHTQRSRNVDILLSLVSK